MSTQWALTCLFYSALHYIDAHLCDLGSPSPGSHGERTSRVAELGDDTVYRDYRWLRDQCHDARYRFLEPTGATVEESWVRLERIRNFATPEADETIH